ncbi:MAG: hypothetical protein Q3966_07665 [Neisseria sp.]|nr:hypothetical protein [Neisseria sp.]
MVKVIYCGMPCELIPPQPPYPAMLRILSPEYLKQAYDLGFRCIGYPNEVCKDLSEGEYSALAAR